MNGIENELDKLRGLKKRHNELMVDKAKLNEVKFSERDINWYIENDDTIYALLSVIKQMQYTASCITSMVSYFAREE